MNHGILKLVLIASLTTCLLAACSNQDPTSPMADSSAVTADDLSADVGLAFVDPAATGAPSADKYVPWNFYHLGGTPIADAGTAVSMQGDLAYVTSYSPVPPLQGALEVFDLSDPASPTLIGSTDGDESGEPFRFITDLRVDGDRAYLADFIAEGTGTPSLTYQVDISQPTAPTVIDFATDNGNARGVTSAGAVVYDARFLNGFLLWDVDGMDLLGESGASGLSIDIEVSGRYAYVCGGLGLSQNTSTLEVWDVQNPADLVMVGSKRITPGASSAWDVELYPQGQSLTRQRYACVVDGQAFTILDVTFPASITVAATVDQFTDSSAYPVAVQVEGDRAYVAMGYAGVYAYDISTPTAPSLVGHWKQPQGFARDVDVQDDLVSLVMHEGTLETVLFTGP